MTLHSVRIPVGLGKHASKRKGGPPSIMAHLKRSVAEVKAEDNCFTHSLIQKQIIIQIMNRIVMVISRIVRT